MMTDHNDDALRGELDGVLPPLTSDEIAHELIEAICFKRAMYADNIGLPLNPSQLEIIYNAIANHAKIEVATLKRRSLPVKIGEAIGVVLVLVLAACVLMLMIGGLFALARWLF